MPRTVKGASLVCADCGTRIRLSLHSPTLFLDEQDGAFCRHTVNEEGTRIVEADYHYPVGAIKRRQLPEWRKPQPHKERT